jgi:hypothetical protein
MAIFNRSLKFQYVSALCYCTVLVLMSYVVRMAIGNSTPPPEGMPSDMPIGTSSMKARSTRSTVNRSLGLYIRAQILSFNTRSIAFEFTSQNLADLQPF